jgi:hypothetical protein
MRLIVKLIFRIIKLIWKSVMWVLKTIWWVFKTFFAICSKIHYTLWGQFSAQARTELLVIFWFLYNIWAGWTWWKIFDNPWAYPYDGTYVVALVFGSMILWFWCWPSGNTRADDDDDDDDDDDSPYKGLEYW